MKPKPTCKECGESDCFSLKGWACRNSKKQNKLFLEWYENALIKKTEDQSILQNLWNQNQLMKHALQEIIKADEESGFIHDYEHPSTTQAKAVISSIS